MLVQILRVWVSGFMFRFSGVGFGLRVSGSRAGSLRGAGTGPAHQTRAFFWSSFGIHGTNTFLEFLEPGDSSMRPTGIWGKTPSFCEGTRSFGGGSVFTERMQGKGPAW